MNLDNIKALLEKALSSTPKDELITDYIDTYANIAPEDSYSSIRFIITDEEAGECDILIEFSIPVNKTEPVNKVLRSNGITDLTYDCITLEVKGKLPPVDFNADDIDNCFEDEDKIEVYASVSVTDNVYNNYYYINLDGSFMIDTYDIKRVARQVAIENEDEL